VTSLHANPGLRSVRTNPSVFANLGRKRTLLETVGGFSRYREEVRSLPPAEQARIERMARFVAASHTPGQRPIVTIRVVGHADFDTPRRPVFEHKISGDRARNVLRALMVAIDRHAALTLRRPLSGRIRWEHFAMGATRPLHPTPRSGAERARNRRVEILLEAVPVVGEPRSGLMIGALSEGACTVPSLSQSAIVKSGGIVFTASMAATAFNPMPKGFVQQFRFAKEPSTRALRFSCHRVEARKDCPVFVIPAWAYDGAVRATLQASEDPNDWEYGFIQTVQSSRLLHVYDGSVGRECVIAAPTRDALAGSPPPWMQPAAVTTLGSSTPASLEDSPFTVARIDHPTQPQLKLRQVCIEGTFLIWLVARKKTSSAQPVLLLFKEITVGRTWEFDPKKDPMDPDAWIAFGGQFESRSGDGNTKNAPRPKLDGPTANSGVATCFVSVTGKRCKTEEQRQFLTHCIVGGSCGGVRRAE
jgi:hypothetical protein